ncbi:MAG: hypothetical protein LBH98_06070 [Chitinispirillales bacterium]|jgi:hypothetical protein|nr:hypothetical protein [Chitinispirillales bacterium]
MQQYIDDEFDSDEHLIDKDSIPLADDDGDNTELQELAFESKFDRNAHFSDMVEDLTAIEDWA